MKQRKLEADNYRLDKIEAIGQFLPGVSGSVSAQYSYGRSVDPGTNTYISQSTFNNGYAMEGSMPIFQGGSLINQVRRARANELLGKAALQEAKDNTALETFQAYIDALYYYGTTRLAEQKLVESDSLVYKTRRQEALGLKGMADVAQMEAQQATDAYNLTHQRNLYETANAHPEADDELSRSGYPRARHPADRHTRHRTGCGSRQTTRGRVPHRPQLQPHPAPVGNEQASGADEPQDIVGLALPYHQHLRWQSLLLIIKSYTKAATTTSPTR